MNKELILMQFFNHFGVKFPGNGQFEWQVKEFWNDIYKAFLYKYLLDLESGKRGFKNNSDELREMSDLVRSGTSKTSLLLKAEFIEFLASSDFIQERMA